MAQKRIGLVGVSYMIVLFFIVLFVSVEIERPEAAGKGRVERVNAAEVDLGWEHVRTVGMVDMIYIEPGRIADEEVYRTLKASLCGAKRFCKLMAWVDKEIVPYGLPMLAEQERAMVMTYTKNTSTGYVEMLFSCRIIDDPQYCF